MLGEPELPDLDHADGRFTLRDRAGRAHVLPGVEGMSVMEILRAGGFDVAATCGGAAACGTCHVYVAQEDISRLDPAGEAERWQLDHLTLAEPNSRLSCQIVWRRSVLDGLNVTLAPKE